MRTQPILPLRDQITGSVIMTPTPSLSARPRRAKPRIVRVPRIRKTHRGFSLTEVAVAIAVIAFAVVVLVALIPTSLEAFRKAIDSTVTAQIAQRIISEAQETDFEFLVNNERNAAEETALEFSRLPIRYFDAAEGQARSGGSSRRKAQRLCDLG
jgi:prepilin-type N-terminal cleavage/methylation domain-containing protein